MLSAKVTQLQIVFKYYLQLEVKGTQDVSSATLAKLIEVPLFIKNNSYKRDWVPQLKWLTLLLQNSSFTLWKISAPFPGGGQL